MRITNAFSLGMLPDGESYALNVEELTEGYIRGLDWNGASAVGHPATAAVLSRRLHQEIAYNRVSLSLEDGESILVAQVQLPRLAEGQVLTEEEMDGVPIRFLKVTLSYVQERPSFHYAPASARGLKDD